MTYDPHTPEASKLRDRQEFSDDAMYEVLYTIFDPTRSDWLRETMFDVLKLAAEEAIGDTSDHTLTWRDAAVYLQARLTAWIGGVGKY